MAFGQPSGPPASAKQVGELLALLHAAGHTDFRDARGPLGLTQRQAAGKFTRDEVSALIDQLSQQLADADAPSDLPAATGPTPEPGAPPARHPAAGPLRRYPSEQLAAELQRRGWIVVEP